MTESKNYHNTTNQSKDFVTDAIRKCKSQDEKVISIILLKGRSTASEVWKVFKNAYGTPPLTSIRRSLSNLTHEGKLKKEDKTKIGLYGRPECYYTLNVKP